MQPKRLKQLISNSCQDYSPIFTDLKEAKASTDGWVTALCPFHDDSAPSFGYRADSGRWHCFSGCGSGSIYDYLQRRERAGSFAEAVELAAAELGITVQEAMLQLPSLDEFAVARGLARETLDRWQICSVAWRKRPALRYPTALGIDRIKYLDHVKPKYGWARKGGRAHWYGLRAALRLGVELWLVNGEPAVWALAEAGIAAICTCAGEDSALPSPMVGELVAAGVEAVHIVYDLDVSGRKGAQQVAVALRSGGLPRVTIRELPTRLGPGGDVGDLYRLERERFADTLRALPELDLLPVRPIIAIDVDLDRVVCECISALAADQSLYIRSHQPVTVVPAEPGMDLGPGWAVEEPAERREEQPPEIRVPPGAPVIWSLDSGQLQRRLSMAADFVGLDARSGEQRPKPPPRWAAEMAYGDGLWPGWRRLKGISGGPLMAVDGSLVTNPGYDHKTGFYLSCALPKLSVPSRPGKGDVLAAVNKLLGLIVDFAFISDCDRASWIALLLTLVARPAILGPTPLFVFGANIRGAGKTLAVDLASIIATGTTAPSRSWPAQKEEREKVLVALALRGLPLCNFDNVTSTFGGDPIDNWLTSTSPSGRVLGASRELAFDWRTVLSATMNNGELRDDTVRRTIYALQQVYHEFPESRTGFQQPDIKAHCQACRGEYLSAAMTILRAHAMAGWPSRGGRPKGSFEAWCRVVRDALLGAGLPDVERKPDDPAIGVNQERVAAGVLFGALHDSFGSLRFTVAELAKVAYPGSGDRSDLGEALEEIAVIRRAKGQLDRRRIGQVLRTLRNRPCDGLVLRDLGRGGASHMQIWQVCPAGNAGNSGIDHIQCGESGKLLREEIYKKSRSIESIDGIDARVARTARDEEETEV